MDLPNAPSGPPAETTDSDTDPALLMCCLSPVSGAQIDAALAAQTGTVTAVTLADIPAMLADRPEAQAIILYDSPVMTLMARVPQGDSAEAVLAEWSAKARQVLETQTRNRRRIAMIEARSVLLYADVFAARFGLSSACVEALATLPRPSIDPVLLSLAQAFLQENREARQLVATLRAATTELSNSPPEQVSELETAFAHYAQAKSHLGDLRAELEQHLLQESAVKQALGAAEKRASDLAAELSRRDRSNADLAQKEEALKAEIDTLQARLDKETDLREQVAKDLDRMSQTLQTIEADSKAKGVEVERLRAFNAEFTAERTALTGKLKHAEADLESQYHRCHQAEAALEEIRQKTDALAAETATKTVKIETLIGHKEDLETRLADTEAWLQGILASRSYRMMAPVRRLRAMFKRKE